MLPSICFAPYFNRSHAHTYAIATTKNAAVHITKIKSRIAGISSDAASA